MMLTAKMDAIGDGDPVMMDSSCPRWLGRIDFGCEQKRIDWVYMKRKGKKEWRRRKRMKKRGEEEKGLAGMWGGARVMAGQI
jgi:hypothetical protein